jgi:hypothetical protein
MKIIKNEKLIQRNGKIGQWTSLAALAVLGVGMYISFQRPDLFFYSIGALIVGFAMTQIGMFFSNRWGRSPRPDEQLDAALKGLPGDTSIYHYVTPVSHLLVGPAGIWILRIYHQRGLVTYSKNRWRLSGGGFMQAYMTIFGQEGLGRPELEVASEVDSLKKFLAKQMEGSELPEIQAALVFTNEQAEIDDTGAPLPVLKLKQLKEFIRQKSKDRAVGQLTLEKIKSVLPQEE